MWKLSRHCAVWILTISCCVHFLFGQSNNWRPDLPSTLSGQRHDSTREERPLPTARLGPEDHHLLWINEENPSQLNDPSAIPPPNIPGSLPWDHPADGFHNPVSPTVNAPKTGSQEGVPVGNDGSTGQRSSLLDQNMGILLDPSVSSIRDSHIPPSPLEFPSGHVGNFVAVNESTARNTAAERRRERRRRRRLERERARANFLDAAARDQAAIDAFDGNNQEIFPVNNNPPSAVSEPIPGQLTGGQKRNNKKKNKAKKNDIPLNKNADIALPPGFVPLTVPEQLRLLETISLLEEENSRLTLVVSEQRKIIDDMVKLAAEKARVAAEKEKADKIATEKRLAAEIAAEKERAARIAAEKEKAARVAAEKERAARIAAEKEMAAKIAAEKEKAARIAAEKERLLQEAEARRLAELQKPVTPKPVVYRRRRRRRFRRFFG